MHLIHERAIELTDSDGLAYDRALVWAEPLRGGTWAAFIEFTSAEERTLRTGRETTQSRLDDVAYWASGLKPMYLEGAFRRALKRRQAEEAPPPDSPFLTGPGKVTLCVETIDPDVPRRLLGSRTLVPGRRRQVHGGGVLVYEGLDKRGHHALPAYAFLAQYGSDNASAIVANAIWNDLHGRAAQLSIDGVTVPIDHIAIKHVMLGALVR